MELNKDAIAVVTGAASGLGAATARRLASRGARVAVFDMNAELGRSVADEIGGVFCEVDVSVPQSVQAAFAQARNALGQERILINCVGIGGPAKTASRDKETGEIRSYPIEQFQRIIQVNLTGTFCCITTSAAGMLTLDPLDGGERGVIVNTASVAAEDGQAGQAAYAASKAGIVGLTLPVARDLACEGIRINTILPGTFDTPLLRTVSESGRAGFAAAVLFPKRLGRPEEFAQLAETLIECGYLNGEDIRLDGAIRLQPGDVSG